MNELKLMSCTWLGIWKQTCFFTRITVFWGRAFSCIRWFNCKIQLEKTMAREDVKNTYF